MEESFSLKEYAVSKALYERELSVLFGFTTPFSIYSIMALPKPGALGKDVAALSR